MAQQRFINFGDTILARRINQIATAIVDKGVLSGANFSVGLTGNTLRVGPSKVMLGELLLIETGNTDLILGFGNPPSLPQDPVDWTIVYEHINENVQGGVPALMLAVEGLFGFEDLDNSTVLGWVRYPGGNIPLSPEMFLEAPKIQVTNPQNFTTDVKVPPFVPNTYVFSESPTPGAITKIDEFNPLTLKAFMTLTNSSASVGTIVQYFPFVTGPQVPNKLLLEANAELGASVTVSLVAEDGSIFPAQAGTVSNTSGIFEEIEVSVQNVDASKFLPNRPFFVSVTTQLNPGRKAEISLVGASSSFLPF